MCAISQENDLQYVICWNEIDINFLNICKYICVVNILSHEKITTYISKTGKIIIVLLFKSIYGGGYNLVKHLRWIIIAIFLSGRIIMLYYNLSNVQSWAMVFTLLLEKLSEFISFIKKCSYFYKKIKNCKIN